MYPNPISKAFIYHICVIGNKIQNFFFLQEEVISRDWGLEWVLVPTSLIATRMLLTIFISAGQLAKTA